MILYDVQLHASCYLHMYDLYLFPSNILLTCYVDNNGVLGGLLRGSCAAADLNQAIGRIWLDIAKLQVGLYVVRVESRANIADGPTREYLDLLYELDAVFVEPKLPEWCKEMWAFPVA